MISILISFLYFSFNFINLSSKKKNCHYVILQFLKFIYCNKWLDFYATGCRVINLPFLIQLICFYCWFKKFQNIISNSLKIYLDYSIKKIYGLSFLRIIYIILFLLFLLSIGPINQSDVVNYYVGYPFQYYLRNSHFVSGDLAQGLLGIGDFANIAFIQEKSIWLIRFSQYLPLIPICFLLCKRNIPKIIILIFISSPVFIQWLTVGKINFLGDCCLAIIYLCWKNRPSIKYALLTISAGLIATSIKISSLLIFLPIFFDFLIYYKFNFRTIYL